MLCRRAPYSQKLQACFGSAPPNCTPLQACFVSAPSPPSPAGIPHGRRALEARHPRPHLLAYPPAGGLCKRAPQLQACFVSAHPNCTPLQACFVSALHTPKNCRRALEARHPRPHLLAYPTAGVLCKRAIPALTCWHTPLQACFVSALHTPKNCRRALEARSILPKTAGGLCKRAPYSQKLQAGFVSAPSPTSPAGIPPLQACFVSALHTPKNCRRAL